MGTSRRHVASVRAGVAVVVTAIALVVVSGPVGTGPSSGVTARATAPLAPAASQGSPNIVVVMADDMRQDDLRFAPQIRRLLGRGGTQFANSFSPYPLCCPARASFLTGQAARQHGVYSHERPYGYQSFDDSQTLAGAVRSSGYTTAFLGKYLNGYGTDRSLVSGRPSYLFQPPGWTHWQAAVEKPKGRSPVRGNTFWYFNTSYNLNGRVLNKPGEYQTTTLGKAARSVVDRFGRSPGPKPFFLYLNFLAPHTGGPREPDDPKPMRNSNGKLVDLRTAARPDWVEGRFDDVVQRAPGLSTTDESERDSSDKPPHMRRYDEFNGIERQAIAEATRQRAESIFVMDRQIGMLAQTLKRSGQWADTIFVFTSDNGYYLGEHRQHDGKLKLHEPSIRVPLLLAGPGVPQGQIRYDPITTMDLTATIADYAGASARLAEAHVPDGVSMVDVIETGDVGWAAPVVLEAVFRDVGSDHGPPFGYRNAIGIRTGRYKYVRYEASGGELYDLDVDPNELTNLWNASGAAATKAALAQVWDDYHACVGTTCQTPLPQALQRTPADNLRGTSQQFAAITTRSGVDPLGR